MKILLVSNGSLPIPPPSWGGVENVIWQQQNYLTRAGHDVTVFNEEITMLSVLRAKPWQYDLTHLHFDLGTKFWVPWQKLLKFRLAVTSHYGHAAFPAHWTPKFKKTLRRMIRASHHITLSHEIRDMLYERGYQGKAWVLPNGIETSAMHFDPVPSKPALVLGRVQPRKKQRFLGDILLGEPGVQVDLIGPTDEPDYLGNGANVTYLGGWSRDTVHSDLTQYAAMVLISDGEAHAGVLLEAMAAGLSLVVSPESAHNLDTNLPFVFVVDREKPAEIITALKRAIAENLAHRAAIRAYCENTFDWKVIGPRYERILNAIVRGDGTGDGGEPFLYAPGK
ncbi:MAG: glycosyltransferase family 4 protein [Armatimonadetes bacterium]|nr:glycosyltransferase family 4 protein [Armatimonadota bacterium]